MPYPPDIAPNLAQSVAQLAHLPTSGVGAADIRIEIDQVVRGRNALDIAQHNLLVQAVEVMAIGVEAEQIERHFRQENKPLPSVFALFTAGFTAPQDQVIAQDNFGQGVFTGLTQPDILGHTGQVSLLDLGNQNSLLVFNGRPHPNEGHNPIVLNHNLRVIKELARRQRARGKEPAVILTYLTGVDFEIEGAHPGEVSVLMDDAELTNIGQPGFGPHQLFDEYDGARFQPKAGRSSDPKLVESLLKIAQSQGINITPAIVVGTPGNPEYQSVWERSLIKLAFDASLGSSLLAEIIKPLFGKYWREKTRLLYGMGITSELACLRSIQAQEPSIPVLALGLATDTVGNAQSLTIDHGQVFAQATASAAKYMPIIMELAVQLADRPAVSTQDFSIWQKLLSQQLVANNQ